MRRMLARGVLALSLLIGCATAEHGGSDVDASVHPNPDANNPPPPDTGCTVTTVDLLPNGNFDGAPIGTGWSETPIDPTYPIVTSDDGVAEQSPANKAWLGGLEQAASDDLHADVAIPASTTALVVAGYYDVRTGETGTTVYDHAKVELVTTSGTLIETILTLDNAHPQTAWTAFDHTFTSSVAGQTVRLRFTSTSDSTLATSFYFDTLSLKATDCQ
jgi:hypothetical protein